jgi:hypothetical protein
MTAVDQKEHQVQMRLPERDSRGWWTYHRWGVAIASTIASKVDVAQLVCHMARVSRIGFERDGRYWVQ